MKAFKLEFGTYDNEGGWEKTYTDYTSVIKAYRETRKEYEEDDTFEEHEPDQSFGVDGVSCEWYEIEVEGDPAPTGFSGIGDMDFRPLVYLASPYTGNEEENFKAVAKKAAELMTQGVMVFSPISMCHPMAVYGKLPGGWEFWEKFDRAYISVCNKLVVHRLPGWENSKGVQAEIKIAQEMNIPIEYID